MRPRSAWVTEVTPNGSTTVADGACSVFAIDLEGDGGIGPSTIAGPVAAGANGFVSGSALFRDPEGLTHAVADLRQRAEAARA